ncbi:hypothetical protein G6F24_017089 [Rhizopus arrhizus]|nr:hypothetical protein G6F24_017089 [Rhizopus arrhizus]
MRAVQRAAQVAVGEQADQDAGGIDHGGHAQPFAAHFHECFAEAGAGTDRGQVVAGVHDIGDVQQQAAAEAAGRV